jgi:hypothetical protein
MLLKVGNSSKKKVIILHKSEQEKQKDDEELEFRERYLKRAEHKIV